MNGATNRLKRRMGRLKTLPVLPTLFTGGNLACGVTAIMCAAHDMLGYGCILIFVAMFCDMIDGKVARMTGTDGAFGAELDSLADVVSFGVAPAMLMHRLVLGTSGVFGSEERLIWLISILYAVFTAIRLARYNVEHGKGPTNYFRGLPSPGAAAVICSWIGLFAYLKSQPELPALLASSNFAQGWDMESFRSAFGVWVMGLGMFLALLMVSSLPFPHLGNTLLSGQIRFRHLVLLIILLGAMVVLHIYALTLVTTVYVFGALFPGLMKAMARWRDGRDILDEDDDDGFLSDRQEATDVGPVGEIDIKEQKP